jgi:hypothetical protein
MDIVKAYLNGYLTADNIVLTLLIVGVCMFSVLAVRAEQRLWRKMRRSACHRRKQRFITIGKAHLR